MSPTETTASASNANKAIVRRYFEELNDANLGELARELFAPDYVLHFDGIPPLDRAAAVQLIAGFISAFPGIQHLVEDQVAAGDTVATRITVRGTHGGDFLGLPATGRPITIAAINIHRLAGGKIAEQWVNSDQLGMLHQLGVIPTSEQAG